MYYSVKIFANITYLSTCIYLFICLLLQEEQDKEQKRLQLIMEENNKKILEAQMKLVGQSDTQLCVLMNRLGVTYIPMQYSILLLLYV